MDIHPNKTRNMNSTQYTNQKTIFNDINIKDDYFSSQLITYIGNKRRLLPFLFKNFLDVQKEIGKEKMIIFDGFAGSGAVSRLLKSFAKKLYVNDLENYCETINTAYLANKSKIDTQKLKTYINWLNMNKLLQKSTKVGFIEKNYAPKDDNDIQPGERVFYTNKNARIIDNIRKLIKTKVSKKYQVFCLASLLIEASIHTNTSGVFKGFLKRNGIGHFGGDGENALKRIKEEISLEMPIFSEFECPVYVYKKDTNKLVRDRKLPRFDIAYYDPPYNQHPYGSNYFMLNIINEGKPCAIQDGVSGIAENWNRSAYNKRFEAEKALDSLIRNTDAKYILISYNDEGIIPLTKFKNIIDKYGEYRCVEHDYNTYRGSRNLRNRNIKVKELLWILKKNGQNNSQ